MPKISVIIPTYNGGKFIKKAIESVLDQTLDDFEIIVVDDGSTDNTPYILQEYIRTNNIVYISQKNVGVAVARNNGINMSKGTYIAFLDDDDFWIDKDKLKKQIEFLENHPDYVMVGTAGIVVDEKGKRVTDYKVPEGDHSIRDSILMRNPFIQSSIVAKKDILKGEIITENMLEIKRPGTGIEPKYLDKIIRRKAKKNLDRDTLLKFADLK